ncbi:hypothetical protein ACFYVE_17925 [Streptomyces tendae]|uniref:hypothetical protein n=1 Tax=Streptomyces tendae TaxID=1932 RepID=UPI0036BA56E2
MVNTTVWMPAPADKDRGVRGIDLFVRSDAYQLALMVALIDRGELSVDVAEGVPLTELPRAGDMAVSSAPDIAAGPGSCCSAPSGTRMPASFR